jgi:hypothetical protein
MPMAPPRDSVDPAKCRRGRTADRRDRRASQPATERRVPEISVRIRRATPGSNVDQQRMALVVAMLHLSASGDAPLHARRGRMRDRRPNLSG